MTRQDCQALRFAACSRHYLVSSSIEVRGWHLGISVLRGRGMAAQAQLLIRRQRQFFGFMRSLLVYADDRKLGELRSGEQKTFEVPPGSMSSA